MTDIEFLIDKSYDEVCDFLKKKYGLVPAAYFSPSFKSKNAKKISRSKEGLFVHHIDENKMKKLSEKKFAEREPYEYQLPDHLVYCNLLEHFLLHLKIMEGHYVSQSKTGYWYCLGIGGITDYFISDLNDIYCLKEECQEYRDAVTDAVIHLRSDYFLLIERFVKSLSAWMQFILTDLKNACEKCHVEFYPGKIMHINFKNNLRCFDLKYYLDQSAYCNYNAKKYGYDYIVQDKHAQDLNYRREILLRQIKWRIKDFLIPLPKEFQN